MTQADIPSAKYVNIDADRAGQRLDNFLIGHFKKVPKSHVYRILRTGQVRVNKKRVKPHYRVQVGDSIRLPPVKSVMPTESPSAEALTRIGQRLQQAIIYEDDSILVLNKPAGLAVHGGSGLRYGMIEILKAGRYPNIELVHRLDRPTSGCLLLAKQRSVLRQLHRLLHAGEMQKNYLALLAGCLPQEKMTVNSALTKRALAGGERIMTVSDTGRPALTEIVRLQQFEDLTLASINIGTGKTHQIRVHCSDIGHPIAGDEKYGDKAVNKKLRNIGLNRLFLHARSLRFKLTRVYHVEAAIPAELEGVLGALDAG